MIREVRQKDLKALLGLGFIAVAPTGRGHLQGDRALPGELGKKDRR